MKNGMIHLSIIINKNSLIAKINTTIRKTAWNLNH